MAPTHNDPDRTHRPEKQPISFFEAIRRTHQLQSRLLEDTFNGLPDLWDFGGSDAFWSLQTGGGAIGYPPTNPSDRRHGQQWPLWNTEAQLDRLRQRSRVLCSSNSYAQGLLRNRTNYTIGKGYSYNVVPKKKRGQKRAKPDDAVLKLVDQTQEFVDSFLARNQWNSSVDHAAALVVAGTGERESYRRLARDGEAVVRFYFEPDGSTVVRFIDPERLRNPPGGTYENGWSFGKRHQMEPFEDVKTVLEYHFQWSDPATGSQELEPEKSSVGELVPAEEVLHLLGPDTDSTVVRGIPDFSFDTAEALERAKKLQRNVSLGAAIRAAIAETWQIADATATQVSAFAGGMADESVSNPVTGNTENIQTTRPGTVRYGPANMTLAPQPADAATTPGMAASQGDLRQASAAFCAPEYWTGDSSNGNYSSLETASAPPVKQGETEQEYWRMAFGAIVWKAVRWGITKGLLPRDVLKVLDIQVEAAAVLHRNELEKAQKDQILFTMKAKSPQTIGMEDGLDPDVERANFQELEQAAGGVGGANNPLDVPKEEDDPTRKGLPVDDTGDDLDATPTSGGGGNDLRATVGGLNAIAGLQADYYAGKLPREAAMANVRILFSFSPAEAAALFPATAPVKLTPDETPTQGDATGGGGKPFGESRGLTWFVREAENDSSGIKAAKNAVGAALKSGKLKQDKCEECGCEESEAHHDDYRKPLEVRWLCRACHDRTHGKDVPEDKGPKHKPAGSSDGGQFAGDGGGSGGSSSKKKDDKGKEKPEKPAAKAKEPVAKPNNKQGDAEPKTSAAKPTKVAKTKVEKASAGSKVGKAEHVHSDKVESRIAAAVDGVKVERVKGKQLPTDVNRGNHGFEVKALLKGEKHGITVHDDALLRKVNWANSDPDRVFHTVVSDERNTFGGGRFAERFSGHQLYYKRGSGKYTLAQMHPVKDEAELKDLSQLPDNELPEKARGSLPPPPPIDEFKARAEKAHASRLKKDRALKAKKKAEKLAAKEAALKATKGGDT